MVSPLPDDSAIDVLGCGIDTDVTAVVLTLMPSQQLHSSTEARTRFRTFASKNVNMRRFYLQISRNPRQCFGAQD
jgi:hypothetical protein